MSKKEYVAEIEIGMDVSNNFEVRNDAYGVPCGFIDKRTGKNVYFLVTVVDEEDKPLVEGIEITDYNRSDIYKAETLNDILDY